MYCSECNVRMADNMDFCPHRTDKPDTENDSCPLVLEFTGGPSMVSCDIADVLTVVRASDKILLKTSVHDSIAEAAKNAIYSAFLGDTFVNGASNILLSVTGDEDLTMHDAVEAVAVLKGALGENNNSNVVIGFIIDAGMKGKKKVSVLASGIGEAVWGKLVCQK